MKELEDVFYYIHSSCFTALEEALEEYKKQKKQHKDWNEDGNYIIISETNNCLRLESWRSKSFPLPERRIG